MPPGWWADTEVQSIRNEPIAWPRERVASHALFGSKNPRICLLFPLWKEVFVGLDLEPKYVFCVRDPAQVARSVGDRDKFDPSDTEYRWVRYNAHASAGIGACDAALIPYDDWFTNPATNLNRLISHLSPRWAPDDRTLMEAFGNVIAPEPRHHRPDIPVRSRPFTRNLYRLFMDAAPAIKITQDLWHAAINFIMIEQLHSHQQAASIDLARDNAARAAALASQRNVENEMASRLRTPRVALEQEGEIASRANDRLGEAAAASGAANEQIRELEASLTAARREIQQSPAPVPPLSAEPLLAGEQHDAAEP